MKSDGDLSGVAADIHEAKSWLEDSDEVVVLFSLCRKTDETLFKELIQSLPTDKLDVGWRYEQATEKLVTTVTLNNATLGCKIPS